MTLTYHSIRCSACKARLVASAAIRDQVEHTKTVVMVCCPACHNDVLVAIPLGIMMASVRIVSFGQAAEAPRPLGRHRALPLEAMVAGVAPAGPQPKL